jgi:hypothetical protein
MSSRIPILFIVGITAFAAEELIRWRIRGVSVRTLLDLGAMYGGMVTVAVGWMIWDRRTGWKPPPDSPEADYADLPD